MKRKTVLVLICALAACAYSQTQTFYQAVSFQTNVFLHDSPTVPLHTRLSGFLTNEALWVAASNSVVYTNSADYTNALANIANLQGRTSAWDQAATDSADATNRILVLEGQTNSYVKTNDTRTLNWTGATITIADGVITNSPVTRQQMYDALDDASEMILFGATNAHPVITGYASLWQEVPSLWSVTNALSDGTNVIGTFWYTNAVDLIRDGQYLARFYARKSHGTKVVNAYVCLVYTDDGGATTNTIDTSSPSGAIGSSILPYRLSTVVTNSIEGGTNTYLGVTYCLVQVAGGSAATIVTYGGEGYNTQLDTPGLGAISGYALDSTVDAIDLRVGAIESNYVVSVNGATGTVQVVGRTNMTVTTDGTNIYLDATGGGAGSATNWYAYEQNGLIFRTDEGLGTNVLVANPTNSATDFNLTYSTNLGVSFFGIDSDGRTNIIFREYNEVYIGSGGTNWLWYYNLADFPHDQVPYAHMTNISTFPTGVWFRGDAGNASPVASGDTAAFDPDVSYYYGLEADFDFVVLDRYPLDELDAIQARTSTWETASTDATSATGAVAILQASTSTWNTAATDATSATGAVAVIQARTSVWETASTDASSATNSIAGLPATYLPRATNEPPTAGYVLKAGDTTGTSSYWAAETAVSYGTTDSTAYRGDWGAAVSNTAAAALPKTFTNAAAVTTLKITGGSPAVGAVFVVTNANGSGTLQALPKIEATKSTAQVFANNVETNLSFNTTVYQRGGTWDGTTWIPGVVGWAGVNFTLYFVGGQIGNMFSRLYKNGAVHLWGLREYGLSGSVPIYNTSFAFYNDSSTNAYRITFNAVFGANVTNSTVAVNNRLSAAITP